MPYKCQPQCIDLGVGSRQSGRRNSEAGSLLGNNDLKSCRSWRSHMTRSIFSTVVLGIALLPMLTMSPAYASSGTMVITTDTTLTEDHQGNILLNANKVTLDCAGHTVSGPGAPGFNGGIEVAGGLSGVTVR